MGTIILMFERYTDRSRRVLVLTQEEARAVNSPVIGTEHILLGLIREETGIAAQALDQLGVTADAVRADFLVSTAPSSRSVPFTPNAKRLLELAFREALSLGNSYVGTEHLLLAFARMDDGRGCRFLVASGISPAQLRSAVIDLLPAAPSRVTRWSTPAPAADALYAAVRELGASLYPDQGPEALSVRAAAITTEVLDLVELRWGHPAAAG